MAERCAQEIVETVFLVVRFIRKEIQRNGALSLSLPQLRTLAFLSRCPGAGLSSLADDLGVTCPTASAIVNRLVRQGLVTRTDHPRERRCIVLTLTRAGSQSLRHARQVACSLVANVLAGRTSAELQKLRKELALLGDVFKGVVH